MDYRPLTIMDQPDYPSDSAKRASQWACFEQGFRSDFLYDNPLQEVRSFRVTFVAPSGTSRTIRGFWNGEHDWRVRFMPDEVGEWRWHTSCSDDTNTGLHEQSGRFLCEANTDPLTLYQRGAVVRRPEEAFLRHADDTPFFYTACTAWNGTLKSTEAEWNTYLAHRAEHHYTAIQFVTTQWRGSDTNSQLQTAYAGHQRIAINPAFFRHLDTKVDQINAHGLLAAPVLLWALPFRRGRHLSPGAVLPRDQAILLAQYMVARYGGHHVLWILGGDGLCLRFYESRWKRIGRAVFAERGMNTPGVVALHPMGRSWIGDAYANEDWLDVVGYQSGHSTDQRAVDFITKGPATNRWSQLPARPTINMEPCYEELRPELDGTAVRQASFRSVFATPPAGITYGANGIWPWIRPGERILNHGALGRQPTRSWSESLDLPGSLQVGYLAEFMQQFNWWALQPDPALLETQPGNEDYRHFVSLLRTEDYRTILVYFPAQLTVSIKNPQKLTYRLRWFNPAENTYLPGKSTDTFAANTVSITPASQGDSVAVLTAISE